MGDIEYEGRPLDFISEPTKEVTPDECTGDIALFEKTGDFTDLPIDR